MTEEHTKANAFLERFHQRNPGCTSRAFAHGRCTSGDILRGSEESVSSYQLLSQLAQPGESVLDLGCGDGHLLTLLSDVVGTTGTLVGVDSSAAELELVRRCNLPSTKVIQCQAQEMPVETETIDLVVSHFAFHIMTDVAQIIKEIYRVLRPGGRLAVMAGGGPKVGDAFEQFLELALPLIRPGEKPPRLGDRQTRTEDGLQTLFDPKDWVDLSIDDHSIDLSGRFEVVWESLSTIYDLAYVDEERMDALKSAFRKASRVHQNDDGEIQCSMFVRRIQVCRGR